MPSLESRVRTRRFSVDNAEIVQRVTRFFDDDVENRGPEMEARLQRYAKYRQWTEGDVDDPWPGASDVAIPDLMTDSLRIQDTLYNAVLSVRPAIQAKATNKANQDQQETLDLLLDYQAFVENGETWLADAIDAFVNDGHFTAYSPWIKEERKYSEEREIDPIPLDMFAPDYFLRQMEVEFGREAMIVPTGDDAPWDFVVEVPDEDPIEVHFYADEEEGPVTMVVEREVEVFNGPKIIVKDRSEVLHPVRCANLQIPSPSNPLGAPHVILVDYPTLDEIKRLAKSGFYDLIDDETLEELETITESHGDEHKAEQEQKDIIAGGDPMTRHEVPPAHRTFTRMICFDIFDIDEDGVEEDVIWWVIKETGTLCKAKRLTEMFPFDRPWRPFAEESYVPVRGRRNGIGILEMGEALHDARKALLDQIIDSGTLRLTPFGFYRPTGAMKPEIMRMLPGDLYPLADPSRDVSFPNLQASGDALGLNLFSLLGQESDKQTMIGDLQLGRVPPGKASALRTVQGMGMVQAQGEARPERILRRFFNGLTQIWGMMHQLNRRLLPDEKRINVAASTDPRNDPYITVERTKIDSTFRFEFQANAFNTARQMLQQNLQQAMAISVSPVDIQLGLTTPDNIYNLRTDYYKALGLDPMKYVTAPAGIEFVTTDEALAEILQGRMPKGFPMEGPEQHLAALMEFAQSAAFGVLEPNEIQLFQQWIQALQQLMIQLQQQQMIAQAAGQSQPQQQGQGGPPAGPPDQSGQAPVQNNELMDESLPTAGGGGAQF